MKRDLLDYQSHYAKQPYEKYQVHFRKKKLKEILSRYPHMHMLEVGCGMESLFLDIDDFNKFTIVEPADMFYEKALVDMEDCSNKRIRILNGFLEESVTELSEDSYDFILISSLLHEINDVDLFLKSIYKLASKNTILHINVPNADSFHRLLAVEMGLIKSQFEKSNNNVEFQQNMIFNMSRLRLVAENVGFEVVEEGSYSVKPFTQ